MAGEKNDKLLLNNTLMFIINVLNANNVSNWFIGYGTLLGIVRDNSCIHGDDDVDIIIDKNNYDLVKRLLAEKNIEFEYGYGIGASKNILKTKSTQDYCSVDFYMAFIDEHGNFNDIWERVIWSKCYNENNSLIKYVWNENVLFLPFNYEQKLINRYGDTWRQPRHNYKGPDPKKRII